MVKSVSSSVLLSALKWAYIAAFNFLFTGASFRTSFHYPVVWNISQLVLFLPLFCSSAKQRVFPQTLFLSSSPTKAESTCCCVFKEPFIWMMQKDVHMHMSLDALRSFLFWEEVSRQLTHLHAQLVVLTELRSACSQFGMYTNPTQTGNLAWKAAFVSLVMGEKIKTKFKLFSRLDKQTLGLLQSAYKTGWKALEIAVYNGFVCNSSFQWNTDDSGTSYHHTYLLRIQMY